jgi:hypothetical protein
MIQIDGLVEYSKSKIEAMVSEYLHHRVDVNTKTLPIDVELLLENTSDVTLKPADGLLMRFSVEGAVFNENGTRLLRVYVETHIMNGADDARYSAVLGEELSHIELHKALVYQVKSVDDYIEIKEHPKWPIIERDARHFSAALRMPAPAVVREAELCYPFIVDEHGFGEPHTIAKLVRNRLAEIFVVHPSEMNGRLADWPCSLYGRLYASVETKSQHILPPHALVVSKAVQRKIWVE